MQDQRLRQELPELVRREPRILDLLDDSPSAGAWIQDLERPGEEWVSPHFWEALGVDPSRCGGSSREREELIHPDDRSRASESLERLARDPRAEHDLVLRMRRANGGFVRMRSRALAVRGPAGTPTRLVGTHHDVGLPQPQQGSGTFALIVDAAPNAMIMVDRNGVIVLVNRNAETLFGYARAELIGHPVEELIPERFRSSHPAFVAGFLKDPRARAMGAGRELFGRHSSGREVPIEIGLNPVETPDGLFVLASVIDISERRRAEERFRLAVEAAPSAMLMVDRTGLITLVNKNVETLFGYRREELMGKPVETLIPERFRASHPDQVRGFLAEPRARAMGAGRELFGRHASGREIPIEIGLNPVQAPDGLFVLASVIDISERRRADATRAWLAGIVESSRDAIVGRALDGTITSWNRGAEDLFGYSADEAIGQPVSMLIAERSVEDEERAQGLVQERSDAARYETHRVHKDGSEVEVSVTLSPIVGPEGDVLGIASISRDITEMRRRDAELQRSNAELEQFAYVASHDLQEPLRMVANYTELLAQRYGGQLDERADKYIRYASDGARRMQQLVSDLLAFSRVGSQGKPLLPVDAGRVVDDVMEMLGASMASSGASVSHASLPVVLADETQLRQLFQNLIGNAIKFRSEAAPVVRVEAAAKEGRWVFSVTDNGIGIDLEFADRIFQMFQRLHPVGKYEGSGIGLAIAKRIVERHGGRIWLESRPGAGSTFRFTLQPAGRGGS